MARREFSAARDVLEEVIRRKPDAVYLWVILSHALLQEGKDWQRAEEAFRTVLRSTRIMRRRGTTWRCCLRIKRRALRLSPASRELLQASDGTSEGEIGASGGSRELRQRLAAV